MVYITSPSHYFVTNFSVNTIMRVGKDMRSFTVNATISLFTYDKGDYVLITRYDNWWSVCVLHCTYVHTVCIVKLATHLLLFTYVLTYRITFHTPKFSCDHIHLIEVDYHCLQLLRLTCSRWILWSISPTFVYFVSAILSL